MGAKHGFFVSLCASATKCVSKVATRANGVVFFTDDRHPAEISKPTADNNDGVGDTLFDVCSSSSNTPIDHFTKSKVRFADEINSYLVGLAYVDVNSCTVLTDRVPAVQVVRFQVREESGPVARQQRLAPSHSGRNRSRKPSGPGGFTNLDPARLLDAWRRQGVLADRRGGRSARSSGSSCAPSAPPPS